MSGSSDTFTAHPPGESGATVAPATYLFLVLEGGHPGAGGARYCLDEIALVQIGRGRERATRIADRILKIELPDRRLSSKHARIERSLTGWELVDDGSKNGCFVGGAIVGRAPLSDGDEIELGHALFVFRDRLPPNGTRAILDAEELGATPPGLATMLPSLARALDRVALVAESTAPVLLLGETGTGKEVLARAIHERSGRAGAFVALHCGAIPAGLIESELFGHRRGAFTGADEDRPGQLRAADGGTLLLDEIGDLPPAAQVALLRVLNEREVVPVGATRPVPVDFRLVSATHRDLDELVADGSFREDLFARLGGFCFELPALRDRREDLGLIIRRLAASHGVPVSIAAARQLYRYSWPRNIRELAACLSTATALSSGETIEPEHLPDAVADAVAGAVAGAVANASASDDLPNTERGRRSELVTLLREHRGNVSAIARELGKARMQVQRWLKRYALDADRYRD